MGIHRYLRMRKVLQYTISSPGLSSFPTNIFLKNQLGILMIISCRKGDMYFSGFFLFPLADTNHVVMEEKKSI